MLKSDYVIVCVDAHELSRNFSMEGIYAVACRGLMWPRRLIDWMPPFQILVLKSGACWSLLLNINCLWRHSMTSFSRLETNVLAKFVDTTFIFRKAGAVARGAVKEFGAMETYKIQKNRYQLRLFLFINNVDQKDHNKIVENHSEFSG